MTPSPQQQWEATVNETLVCLREHGAVFKKGDNK